MVDLTSEEFELARARGQDRLAGPRAESAHFDQERNRIVVRLTTGMELGFAPQGVQGLQNAALEELQKIEIDGLGLGIHFPAIDVDLYVPALLEGLLGSKHWMAARLGAEGGRSRTPAKAAASRANGKKGGRPLKAAHS